VTGAGRRESSALVTGAAGFIGSNLCEQLVSEGVAVRGVDAFTDYYDPAIKRANVAGLEAEAGFELVEGDLNSVDLASLLEGVEAVYHLAGQPGVRASWGKEFDHYAKQNVLATQRLLEATREAGSAPSFAIASSSSIYGDAENFPTGEEELPRPVSPYGVTKLAAEHLGRLYQKAFGVPVVALRYFTIFGPRQRPDMAFDRFIDAALEGRPITVYGDGEQVRDFTYVGDCVSATISAARRGELGAVYNIAGGTAATVLDVLEILEELIGKEIARDHQPAIPGDARKTGADTSRAREVLGYEPAVTLAEGIRRQLDARSG
jgi:nucleoside-diphosphate-sugar epimerase